MSSTNSGPAQTQTQNVQPLGGTFDAAGKLVQILGPGGSVAFDPSSVAITGGVIGGVPVSTTNLGVPSVAAQLVAAYEAQQRENTALGHYLEPRTGLTAADTPTISGSGTIPSSDATDPATQRISLFGSDLTAVTELSLVQATLGKRWLRGFSPGAYGFGEALSYRLSSSMGPYNAVGNQNKRPSDNYGYDAGIIYADLVLDGDVLYTRIESNDKFYLWVNDNLIGATATLGPNTTFDAASIAFVPGTAGHGYTKIKFPSVARRTIRIAVFGASSIGDFWTRVVSTLTPRHTQPIEWVHFGDSFSQYTAATTYRVALSEYMNSAFGRNINFINVAQGGTSFANTPQNFPGSAPVSGQKASFYQQFLGHWASCSPQIISCLIGHNDATLSSGVVTPRVTEMLTAVRATFPRAIILAFTTNASPGIIGAAQDISIEQTMLAAISALNLGIITMPMQSPANVYGPFLRGTGKVGATNGSGNTDLYTSADGTHPSDAGHKATGLWMAARAYDALRAIAG